MISNYKYDNMIIENNRTIFKNFEEFELCNKQFVFPIQITEIELNLMENDYECILYINNHIEVSRFVIDDVHITKSISIINNLKEIKLIEEITILFHYEGSLFKMIIRTNINEEKEFPLKTEKVELKNIINPITVLEMEMPSTFIDPMATFNTSPVTIDLSKDEDIVYADEESEKAKMQSKTIIDNNDIMKDIGTDICFNESFDDLI